MPPIDAAEVAVEALPVIGATADPDAMDDAAPDDIGDDVIAADEPLLVIAAELLEPAAALVGAAVELEPQAVAARASTANPAITPDRLKELRVVTTRI